MSKKPTLHLPEKPEAQAQKPETRIALTSEQTLFTQVDSYAGFARDPSMLNETGRFELAEALRANGSSKHLRK